MSALAELVDETWDEGNEAFPSTTLQISNLHSGTGATNVIPGTLEVSFNLRFSTELTAQQIIDRTEAIFDRYALNYNADWRISGLPFLTSRGKLISAAMDSILGVTGQTPELSTAGGTSDGRFIAPMGTEVVELGPINASIHQVDEHVRMTDLDLLTEIYQALIDRLLRAK
jgi:succinyl-diaminopimelate desuccinylase